MRDLLQPERTAQFAPLRQQGHQAPVVRPKELLQDQEGKELWLGVVVPREAARIRRQSLLPDCHRFPGDLNGRFGHGAYRDLQMSYPSSAASCAPLG